MSTIMRGKLPLAVGSYPGFITVADCSPVKRHKLTFRMVYTLKGMAERERDWFCRTEAYRQNPEHHVPWEVPLTVADWNIVRGLLNRGLVDWADEVWVDSSISGWAESTTKDGYCLRPEGWQAALEMFPEGETLQWGSIEGLEP